MVGFNQVAVVSPGIRGKFNQVIGFKQVVVVEECDANPQLFDSRRLGSSTTRVYLGSCGLTR